MNNKTSNRYSSDFLLNSVQEYRGVSYDLEYLGMNWRIRSKLGQFYDESLFGIMKKFKLVVDSALGARK